MIRETGIWKAGRGGIAFAASSCLSILIALVCALAPLGLPASVTAGSAFNPATTSVVLKARAPVSARQIEVTRPDGGGTGVPGVWSVAPVLAAFLLPLSRCGLTVMMLHRPALTCASSLHRHSTGHARAPPASF
ncbi:MAG: hypothetical protein ABW164_07710 [Sphingobium sp.]